MIDRSVISKRDPRARRITKDEINTLKLKVVNGDHTKRPFGHKLTEVLRSIVHYCTFASGMKNQCKLYGHRSAPKVNGEQLYCSDCGSKIKSPSQLRTATPLASRYQDLGDGSWR
ncbi:MAG: hypothetical protein K2X93_08500 [Candidatus Obscuribacterales bacterium]|nr:hypothetical protein [Candidatus Obscuribacterales bacterium]